MHHHEETNLPFLLERVTDILLGRKKMQEVTGSSFGNNAKKKKNNWDLYLPADTSIETLLDTSSRLPPLL